MTLVRWDPFREITTLQNEMSRLMNVMGGYPNGATDRAWMPAVDAWETEYLHTLEGPDPVLAWVRGTALVPVREALPAEMYAAFEVEYGARLREAYPPEEDGTTLLPFRRIFIVLATGFGA